MASLSHGVRDAYQHLMAWRRISVLTPGGVLITRGSDHSDAYQHLMVPKKQKRHHHLVIDIQETREKFKHYKTAKAGYKGLVIYIAFCLMFLLDLKLQQHEPAVGRANLGLQQTFQKNKADIQVVNAAQMWSFMAAKVVPVFLTGSWQAQIDGVPLTGRTSDEYFYVMGGLILTAKKSWVKENCILDQPCYSADNMDAPHINLPVPATDGSKATTIQVPYRPEFGGYSVSLPSTATPAEVAELLAAYAPMFSGSDTRSVRFDAIMFNPHGEKTITALTYEGAVTIENDIAFTIDIQSIPFYIYAEDNLTVLLTIALEIFNVCYVLRFFVRPFWDALTGEPAEEDNDDLDAAEEEALLERNVLARLQYLSKWEYLPIDSNGEVIWKAPLCQWLGFFIAIGFWIKVLIGYTNLPDFFGTSFVESDIFVSPFLGHETADTTAKIQLALDSLQQVVAPFRNQAHNLCNDLQLYYNVQMFTVLMMTLRFFQYLSFQKRLSMVTDTFNGIFDDLVHISLILSSVCFTVGVMSSLAFGPYDPAFQFFIPAFWEMFEQCFALFKPSSTLPYNPPTFKYLPHAVLGNEVMKWAPNVITLFFKCLVMLLLFKLLMGVIMEGYKTHAKGKYYPWTLRKEIKMMGVHVYRYYILHRLFRKPYISFEQVVLMLALIRESGKTDTEKPWRSRYIGFTDGIWAVEQALNDVASGKLPPGVDPAKRPKIKAIAKHFQFKACGAREAKWVLNHYGIPKKLAMHQMAEHVMKNEQQMMVARLNKERKQEKPSLEEEIQRRAKIYAQGKLEEMEKKLVVALKKKHSDTSVELHVEDAGEAVVSEDEEIKEEKQHVDQDHHTHLTLKYKLDVDEVRVVFDNFDFYGIGQIDIRFMEQAMGPDPGLGFDVPRPILHTLLRKYDEDDNRCYDFKEFSQMVTDPLLQGRYLGMKMKAKKRGEGTQAIHRMETVAEKGVASVKSLVGVFRRSVHKVQALHSIEGVSSKSEPLLQVPEGGSSH